MSFFELAPKASLRALFGRDAEVAQLVRSVEAGRWTVILGPRMVGKTSLVRAAAGRMGRPVVYANLWGARGAPGFLEALLRGIAASEPLLSRLRKGLRRIEGVTVGPAGITLAPRTRPMGAASALLNAIGEASARTVFVLDEVQELAPVSGLVLRTLANVFNTHPNVVFVLTGSQFGLLRMLLEPPADSPLFGRPPAVLRLAAFDRSTSVDFLARGFAEWHLSPGRVELEGVVDRSLDGIPGWLTLYGNNVAVQRLAPEKAERLTLEEGKKVARSELGHFLEHRPVEMYWDALRTLTSEVAWGELKRALSARRGSPVNDHTVGNVLRSLRDANLIAESDHRYSIVDPMVRAYVREARRRPLGRRPEEPHLSR